MIEEAVSRKARRREAVVLIDKSRLERGGVCQGRLIGEAPRR